MPELTAAPVRRTGAATGQTSPRSDTSRAAAPAWQGSVFVTGQVCSREQRRGRYTPASMEHPGKMLPAIARYLIATYTQIGEYVCDPMAGIATTVIEAMHLGRHGIGVEYEARWARLAAEGIHLAERHGAAGTGEILHGDSRHLPALIPPQLHGRIALVITSPPYGPSTHGHVRTPGPRRGKVAKIHHKYGADAANLAYRDHDELAAGFTQILTGAAASPASATADSSHGPPSSSKRTSAPPSPAVTRSGSRSTRTWSCSRRGRASRRPADTIPHGARQTPRRPISLIPSPRPAWIDGHTRCTGRTRIVPTVAPPTPGPTRTGKPKGQPIRARPTHAPHRGPYGPTPPTGGPPIPTDRTRRPVRPPRQVSDERLNRRRVAARPAPEHR